MSEAGVIYIYIGSNRCPLIVRQSNNIISTKCLQRFFIFLITIIQYKKCRPEMVSFDHIFHLHIVMLKNQHWPGRYGPNLPHILLLLLLLFKKISSARLGESDIHPISPKTPAPQYQPIVRKKRKEKRVEDYSRDRAAWANKEALALLLKPASPTPSKTELARSFQRDTEKGVKVLLYCKVLQRGGA